MPSSVTQNAAPVKIVQPKIFNKEEMRYVYEEAATPADIVEYAHNVEYQKVYSSRPKAPLTQPPLMQLQPMVPITAASPSLQSPCFSTTLYQPPQPHQFFNFPQPSPSLQSPSLQSPCSFSTTLHQPPQPHQFFNSPPPPLYPSFVGMTTDPQNQYTYYPSFPSQQFPY